MSEFVELCYDVVWSLQVPFRVIRDFFFSFRFRVFVGVYERIYNGWLLACLNAESRGAWLLLLFWLLLLET